MRGTVNIKEYAVYDDVGRIDPEATVAKFRDDLRAYQSQGETYTAWAEKAVHEVFDKYPDQRLPVGFLLSQATVAVAPEEHPIRQGAVRDYIRINSGDNGMFETGRGPGGGVRRLRKLATATSKPASGPAKRNSTTKQRAVSNQ